MQDEVTQAIVTAIEPQLVNVEQQRARRKPTDNLDAWECYQRGLWHMFSYSNPEQGIHYFERAIELDPEFSSPYSGLAYTYAIRMLLGASPDREDDLQRGLTAADTALRLDSTDSFAHFARGRISIFNGETGRAISEFECAIALNPNYALAHFGLAHGLWHAGRPVEALPHHDEAIRLSPNDTILWAFLASKAIALVMVERTEQGVQTSRDAQRHGDFHLFSHLGEVSGLGLLQRHEEANRALARLKKVEPTISIDFLEYSLPMPASAAKNRFIDGLKLAGLA